MSDEAAESSRLSFAVIVPAYNAEATLAACLDAVVASDRQPDRVIVVNDGSTDGSVDLANQRDVEVLEIESGPRGPAVARNAAADRCADAVLVFVDADVVVHRDTFARLLAPLEADRRVVASFGSYDDRPTDSRMTSLYANLRHHHTHQQAGEEALTFWAGCGAVRRDAFERVGGFDVSYGRPAIEDIELGLRLTDAGDRIRLTPSAQATHLKAWTLGQLWRTDVFRRAAPWSRLLARRREMPSDLNLNWSQRGSAIGAHLVWISALLAIVQPEAAAVGLLAVLGWVMVNRPLLKLLHRRGGARAVAVGAVLHWTYHVYASVVFAVVGAHEQVVAVVRAASRATPASAETLPSDVNA